MKHIKLLVTEIEGEVCIHDEDSLAAMGFADGDAESAFAGVGYFLTLQLVNANWGMKQDALRSCGGDDSLMPQKRFAAAVEKIDKHVCGEDSTSQPEPTENWFRKLEPPELADAIDDRILRAWYPTATKLNKDKTANFIQQWRSKPAKSEA